MPEIPPPLALEGTAQVLSRLAVLDAQLGKLSGWHWVRRGRLAGEISRQETLLAGYAPQLLAAAQAAITTADDARRWGHVMLTHPHQHTREAASGLLEAIGEPVPSPDRGGLLEDLAGVTADRGVIAWDDLARDLKNFASGRYPVMTGTQLRRLAREAGVQEIPVPPPGPRRQGTTYEAVLKARENQ